jgi:hypothetical protein
MMVSARSSRSARSWGAAFVTIGSLAAGAETGESVRMLRPSSVLATLATAALLTVLVPGGAAYAAHPETTITSGPENGALVLPGPVQYTFTADVGGSTFRCKVDSGAFAVCTSPVTYDLPPGGHTFTVYAVDPLMAPDPTPESRIWTVRNVPCEQAGAAYSAAQSAYFTDQARLVKAKNKLHKAKKHGTQHQVSKAKHKVKKDKLEIAADQAAMDAAIAQEHAVC